MDKEVIAISRDVPCQWCKRKNTFTVNPNMPMSKAFSCQYCGRLSIIHSRSKRVTLVRMHHQSVLIRLISLIRPPYDWARKLNMAFSTKKRLKKHV